MPVTPKNRESGFTMITTVLAMSALMMMGAVAVTAVRSDTNLTRYDLHQKQAYEAARAGVEDYAFRLDANGSYWEQCSNVPEPSAVNPQGSTTKRRPVPGSGGESQYAIELLPSSSQSTYTQCSTTNPIGSMIESGGGTELAGSFRVRATGFSGKAKSSVVATFKRPSFLDYVYFTQYETSDPIVYAKSSWLEDAYERCETPMQAGRYDSPIPNSGDKYCNAISFISDETIKGPLHTNDAIVICGDPVFGRDSADSIEVGASPPGWYDGGDAPILGPETSSNCADADPEFKGTFRTNSAILEPPTTNGSLSTVAAPAFRFKGQVRICLNGTSMTVGSNGTCTGVYDGSIPSNGVVYVSNSGTACPGTYSPFTADYPTTSFCGNAYVQGTYSGRLTIAAENDIVVSEDIKKSGDGMLGLIANNFIRVKHECDDGLGNVTIQAAMLAIKHSFIVDHYDCGDPEGTLTVFGAIAQKFRGPVGTFNRYGTASGYSKNYEYDDRLRYQEPPSFLDPVSKSWVIGRETLG